MCLKTFSQLLNKKWQRYRWKTECSLFSIILSQAYAFDLRISTTSARWWHHALHHGDIMMSAMASQITSLTIAYLTVYSDANQRKHQSSASLAFVRGIHRWPVNFPHKGPVTRKMFPFDDVIMETLSAVLAFCADNAKLWCFLCNWLERAVWYWTFFTIKYNTPPWYAVTFCQTSEPPRSVPIYITRWPSVNKPLQMWKPWGLEPIEHVIRSLTMWIYEVPRTFH